MKKILFAINGLTGGGAEKVLINILNNIDYEKYQVDLLVFTKTGVYLDKVNKNVRIMNYILGDDSEELKCKGNLYKKFYSFYRRVYLRLLVTFPKMFYFLKLRNMSYDYEIGFLEGFPSLFISKSMNTKSKKISWIHTNLKHYRSLSHRVEEEMFDKINQIVIVSNNAKSALLELYPQYENKVKVIYNLIDSNDILEKSNEKIEFNFRDKTIIAIGRFDYSKGFDNLLKAHKNILDKGIKHNLIILGDGLLRETYINLINELEIDSSVHLLGFKDNPYPYLKAADIYVMSSRYEGFPLVLTEALLLSKPIVATKCSGAIEILEDGKYGLMVEVESVQSLSDGIEKMINNESFRKYYSEKCHERMEILDNKFILNQINDLFL